MYELRNRTVMVVGGAGFIGSALVRELLDSGAQVVSYDNYLHGKPNNLEGLVGSLIVLQGDILDSSQLTRTIKKHDVDYIINCAGDPFVPDAYEKTLRFFEINTLGTLNLLMTASTCKIKKFVHISSCEVYGSSNHRNLSEDSPLNPLNTYAVSKLAADRLCFTFHLEHGIPIVIARLFNSYGPRETHPYIIPEIISQLNKGNVLYLGNINTSRDFTYVSDTARAILSLLESVISNGEAINVGSGTVYSIEWVIKTLAKIMGISKIEIKQVDQRIRRHDINYFCCDNTKLRHYTNWAPQVKMEEGLQKTLSWFRNHNNQWGWDAAS